QKAAVRALTFALADELGPQGVHVATVTVAGTLAPTGHFAPERVAEEFWRLHAQPPDSWQTEVVYG
ncbi:MAG: short-chain dehydrogenase, partial [Actinomycetota bacterium]